MKQNLLLATIFLLFLHNCMIWEEAHLPGYNSVSGKEAKEEIAQATWEAVSTGQLLWLAQNGMQAGVGPIGSISAINGFLASFLQPILSTIPDDEFYTQESLDQCTKDIRGQGALIYGTFLDSLPVARGITGFIRDGIFLPELASCDLNETGKIIYIDTLINL
ncbi:MAG: TIGR04452 family lipoprotein [Leptospira sp.]|nr:TIGR04452 family lipoprotein [Leptospira sp.]NCS93148.1 TIGR04452 family lipoprotein [Leptospira sp.]